MKANWLIKRIIFTLMVALTIFLDSSSLWAQVKIGANPTVINSANNLEVEASTTGRKTSVDKTTGQVTVKDGTEGAGKILTSDVNGAASWQPAINSMIVAKANATTSVTGMGGTAILQFGNVVFDRGSNFNSSTGTYTAPTDGIYYIKAYTIYPQIPQPNQVWLWVYKNGAQYQNLYLDGQVPVNTLSTLTGSCITFLSAGDIITIRAQSNVTTVATDGSIEIARFSN